MKEKDLVERIRTYLKKQGFWVTKLHGGPTQQAGLPDLLAIKDGRAFFFEIKTETGKLSPLQEHTLDQLRSFGAVAEMVRSVEDVQMILRGEPF